MSVIFKTKCEVRGKKLTEIGIVYFTKTDITGKLVAAAKLEIEKAGVKVIQHRISGSEIVDGRFINVSLFRQLQNCEAIIFASPTYMGGASAQFKAFADATSELWVEQEWAGKIAAGITSGTGLNGDQSSTLQYFITLASLHGMLWLGLDAAYGYKDHGVNRLGNQLGVVAQTTDSTVNAIDLLTAKYLGQRVVKFALKLSDKI